MKISYDSIWSKIYKFTYGVSNEFINTDFFKYWIKVFIGIILFPITMMSVIVEKLISDLFWNVQTRVFSGVIIWSIIVSGIMIVYTLNMIGQVIILWQVAWFLTIFALVVYLILFKFPFVGEYIVHVLYFVFSWLNKIINFRLKLEFDKEDVYIIFDITKLDSNQITEFIEVVDSLNYDEVKNKTPFDAFHIVIPKNGCDTNEYSNEKYIIYEATKFGKDIKKQNRL